MSGTFSGNTTVQATYDTAATLPAITAPVGYTLAGWAKEDGATSAAADITQSGGNYTAINLSSTPSDTFNLYPVWATKTYNITYNRNNGSGTATGGDTSFNITTTNINLGTGTGLSRTGYTFAGWSNTSTGTAINSPTATTLIGYANGTSTSITLYAVWTPTSYGITWNLDSGTLSGQKTSYTIEESYTLPTPTRASATSGKATTSYIFAGWYTENTFKNKKTEITQGSTGEKSFYAKWVEFTMIQVQGGEALLDDSYGQYRPTVSTFKMGKYEVTQAQWEAVMENKGNNVNTPSSYYGAGDDYPQYYVTWYDAVIFCNELSKKEGKTPCYYYGDEKSKTDYRLW